jgi:hypothetical protein
MMPRCPGLGRRDSESPVVSAYGNTGGLNAARRRSAIARGNCIERHGVVDRGSRDGNLRC